MNSRHPRTKMARAGSASPRPWLRVVPDSWSAVWSSPRSRVGLVPCSRRGSWAHRATARVPLGLTSSQQPQLLAPRLRLGIACGDRARAVGVVARPEQPVRLEVQVDVLAHGPSLTRMPARPLASSTGHRDLNNVIASALRAFPTPQHTNVGFYQVGAGSAVPFSVFALDVVPDLHVTGAGSGGQFFGRWRYEPTDPDGMLALGSGEAEVIGGYRKIDNVTDEAVRTFRVAYGQPFTKDDILFYVYGLLHSAHYREAYAADLKKSLPRIPLVADAAPFVEAGRKLSELHLGYETVAPFPLVGLAIEPEPGSPYEYFQIEKMKFAKARDPESNKLVVADRSTIIYNDRITLSGIPEEAYRYMLGSRSAIEWIIDRYQVKTDKASGIVNDPNDWSRAIEDPRYIIDLLARIVTVSLETMKIVDSLPTLDIREGQG